MQFSNTLIGTGRRRVITLGLGGLLLAGLVLMWWLDHEPAQFDPVARASARAEAAGHRMVPGYVTTATLIEVVETLLHKRGGYMNNDVLPPWSLLDNMPNWEVGVVFQARDLARALRNDFSRSQTQSGEDPSLAIADPQLAFDNASWLLPSTEREYRKAVRALEDYLERLGNDEAADARFYARADNLREYLALVEKRLGDIGQRLAASRGERRRNTDLSGDPSATESAALGAELWVRTPWLEIDDVFYQARGTTWALVHFLRAIEHDFAPVLEDKNARASLQQIIRELEASQRPLLSPVVLNGSGFGLFANHSLVMASYIARANAAVIDLRRLLEQG